LKQQRAKQPRGGESHAALADNKRKRT